MNTVLKIIISISLLLLVTVHAQALSQNYIIVGHIYPPYISDHVTIRNQETNEEMIVQIIDCDHNLKEYLFDLANLKKGWKNGDKLRLFYGNKSEMLTVDDSMAGIQADFNRPLTIPPESIIAGTILILASSGYYYIKRKRKRKEEEEITMVELTDTGKEKEPVTIAERVAVIIIFGAMAIFCLYKDNFEAAAGFASTIAVYFLSRQGT